MSSTATSVIEHITIEGERWDQLAYRYYGDPGRVEPIIRANPDVAIVPILTSGIKLRIPVLAPTTSATTGGLPPWKQ